MNTSGQGGNGTRNGKPVNNGTASAGESVNGVTEIEVAVIGPGVRIRGDVEADVDLQIDGEVFGDVRCDTVLLSEGGVVSGSITAQRIRVAGRVEGGIEAADVAIEASARIKGEVSYSRLRISNGGIFEGTMTHRPLAAQGAGEEEKLKLVSPDGAKPQRVHYID
jgi:cytoskeletal protein CcmA (bactofilin family)